MYQVNTKQAVNLQSRIRASAAPPLPASFPAPLGVVLPPSYPNEQFAGAGAGFLLVLRRLP
ncbi:hypothetical protein GCM10009688_08070 [Arthrobacter gandavensis]|uniref:Uncharacterized protein n=1 Tax=Arthrobacter gandavensis TaxID=169960 RepID=A0ABN2NXP4_9MICC